MLQFLSLKPLPSDRPLDDWFSGKQPDSFLNLWQRRAEQRPQFYLWAFSAFWLVWTLAYMAAMHLHVVPVVAVHAAPHVGYPAIVLGAVLFPRQNWWLPMGLFTVLFAITLPGPEMQPFLRNGAGMTIGAVTFAMNMALGLGAAHLAQRLARTERDWHLSEDVIILGVIFATTPLVAVTIHMSEWLIAIWLSGHDAALTHFGYSTETALHVVHRGIRMGIVALALVVLAIRPPERREIWFILMSVPLTGILALMHVSGNLIYPELLMATVMLSFAVMMAPTVIAGIIGITIWPFALWSGIFVLPLDFLDPETLLTELVSSVLIVLLAILVVIRLQAKFRARDRDTHLAHSEKMRDLADVGRFTLDPEAGWIKLDAAAQRLTGADATSDLGEFINQLDEPSRKRVADILVMRSGGSQAVTLHRPSHEGLAALDLKICFWFDEDLFSRILLHGYLINLTDEFAREAKLRFALSRLAQHNDGAQQNS